MLKHFMTNANISQEKHMGGKVRTCNCDSRSHIVLVIRGNCGHTLMPNS